MKLRKCLEHGYTLKEKCPECGKETKEAHYKFVKIRDVAKTNNNNYYKVSDFFVNYV